MIYGTQPEWLTEGIAKYIDGTYQKGISFLLENYIHGHRIPSMSELENEFGEHEYDSYDYAYLMVSYMIETLGKKKFLEVIGNADEIKRMSKNLLLDALCYYNEKYFGNKFYNKDITNPDWLFHGSPVLVFHVEKRMSHASDNYLPNIDCAVFLTPSLLIASAYAFKDTIKNNSNGLKWNFVVNAQEVFPIMTMTNVNVEENITGYVYAFANDGTFIHQVAESLQYKSSRDLVPYEVFEVKYDDFKSNYSIVEE